MTLTPARRIGIVQVLLSGIAFGFLGIFGKTAYGRGIAPGEFLSLRFLIAGALLTGFFACTRPAKLKLGARAHLLCASLGVFGYAVFSSCYFMALKGLSASLTVLLLYMYPVIVAAGAWVFFGEAIERRKWWALPLVMLGLVLLISGDLEVREPVALLFGFASAFFYSVYILISRRRLREIDPIVAAGLIQLAAGLALGAVHWRDPARLIEVVSGDWPLLLATALVCTVLAMGLFLAGLKKLQSWEVSVLSTAEPITGVGLAMLWLGEALSPGQILGAAGLIGAFLLVAWPTKTRTSRPL